MVFPLNAPFNRAAAVAALAQTHTQAPSRAAGSCIHQ
jgi:hypothetical protein